MTVSNKQNKAGASKLPQCPDRCSDKSEVVAVWGKGGRDACLHAMWHRASLRSCHREEHFMVKQGVGSATESSGTPQPEFGD